MTSKSMCTELLAGVLKKIKYNLQCVLFDFFFAFSGVLHAIKNDFKVPPVLKEYWDGQRFCEFKNFFLVYLYYIYMNIFNSYYIFFSYFKGPKWGFA